MYEVNANNNKSFRSTSSKSVASVAVEWKNNGHEPKAFAIREQDGKVTCREIAISTVAKTAKALAAA